MTAILLDDPVERMVLLASSSPADRIMALAGGRHQDVLAALEDKQAATIVRAYKEARKALSVEMETIWSRTFGAGVDPTPAQKLRFLQTSELVQAIDRHLDDLGVLTQAAQGQAWSAGAALGAEQVNRELSSLVADFGGPPALGRSTFGRLDTLAFDLGMTAAVNDTRNLIPEVRVRLQKELQAGAIAGEGIRKLVKRLEPLEGVGATRAELISRWAVIKGHNAARDQAYNDAAAAGITGLQKMWLVTRDERTCPHCLSHWGETVSVETEFDATRTFAAHAPKVYGGVLESPPLHPRCRCTIVSWHERWRGLSTFTPEDFQAEARRLAEKAGLPPKTFVPPTAPQTGLRATRAGRAVIRANAISSTPLSVREAALNKFFTCWVGGR